MSIVCIILRFVCIILRFVCLFVDIVVQFGFSDVVVTIIFIALYQNNRITLFILVSF